MRCLRQLNAPSRPSKWTSLKHNIRLEPSLRPSSQRPRPLRPYISSNRPFSQLLSTHPSRPTPRPPFPSTTTPHRTASFRANYARLFHSSPFSITLATLILLFGSISLLSVPYFYHQTVEVLNARYPEPVAKKLRRALHYTNIDPNAKEALKYYNAALAEAAKAGMQEWGDEVLGLKIQVAAMFEVVGRLDKAVEVLEIVFADAQTYVEKQDTLQIPSDQGPPPLGTRDRRTRTRVLKCMIGIAIKLAELYSDDRLGARDTAEEKLVWAVTSTLRENARRQTFSPHQTTLEGEWMTAIEIAASLESLAEHYLHTQRNYLAAPLYLQAIALVPPSSNNQSCHTCTLMNNLATTLLKQNPPPGYSHLPPTSSPEAAASARAWAEKAIEVAKRVDKGSGERTSECDEAVVAAMVNLGEIALVEGDREGARGWFEEGRRLAGRCGWEEGRRAAQEGLDALDCGGARGGRGGGKGEGGQRSWVMRKLSGGD